MCPRNQSTYNDRDDVPKWGDDASDSGQPSGIDNEAGLCESLIGCVVYVQWRTQTQLTDAAVPEATLSFHLPSTLGFKKGMGKPMVPDKQVPRVQVRYPIWQYQS